MGTRSDRADDDVGPTLYLESTPLDADEAFCTDVFDDASGEYRVVQFTAAQSFESLREALDVQLERLHDPSEAAVIITTPQADEEATTSEVGAGTPLYGFKVNPHDLTGISVAFSRLIEKWDETEGPVKICLRDIESLLPYHDDDLLENADHARNQLEDTDFGTFDVVSPALDYNYDRKMHDVRRLGMEYEDSLTEEERSAFRDLLEGVTMYGVVREYIKDLYIQWALVKLSRGILYAAVISLTVAGGMVVFVDSTTFPGTFLGIESVLWVVSAAFAISALPFLLFTSYILRLATLAKQTLSMGPLMLS